MDQKSLAVRRAQWAQIVHEVNNAPVTKKEWCAQNGINLKAFYYWQRKFRKQAIEASETSSALQVQVTQPPSFVELTLKPEEKITSNPRLQDPDHELILQVDECRLFITGDIKEQTLRTVMKVIRHA